jgi:hypothetical protein
VEYKQERNRLHISAGCQFMGRPAGATHYRVSSLLTWFDLNKAPYTFICDLQQSEFKVLKGGSHMQTHRFAHEIDRNNLLPVHGIAIAFYVSGNGEPYLLSNMKWNTGTLRGLFLDRME